MAQTIKLRRGAVSTLATTALATVGNSKGEVLIATGSIEGLSGPILFASIEDNSFKPSAGRIPVISDGPALASAITATGEAAFDGLTIHSGSKFYRFVDNSTGFSALDVNAGALDVEDAFLDVSANSLVFISSSGGQTYTRKESVTDFISNIAGAGLTATNGVLSTGEGVISASVGSPGDNNQIAYFDGGANAVQGSSNLTFDDTNVSIANNGKIIFRDSSNFIHSSNNGVLTIQQTTATTGKIQNTAAVVEINATTANIGKIGTDDASTIVIGNDDDSATITLQGSVGIENDATVNGSKKIQFGDTGTYIHQSTDGTLKSVADAILEGQAPTVNIGNVGTAASTTVNIGNSNDSATVNIKGDLNVLGDITYVSSETVQIDDNIIELNSNSDDITAGTAGLNILTSAVTASLLYDVANDWWETGDGTNTYRLAEYYNNSTPGATGQLMMVNAAGRLTGSGIVDDGTTITFNSDVDFSNVTATFGDFDTIDGGTF